jgi:hypothetical protein
VSRSAATGSAPRRPANVRETSVISIN